MVSGPWLAVAFFVQAEDGIRDRDVTGVQTCALPISGLKHRGSVTNRQELATVEALAINKVRSEERRVGKECRSGWSADLFTANSINLSMFN